jgi:hypothetical protein
MKVKNILFVSLICVFSLTALIYINQYGSAQARVYKTVGEGFNADSIKTTNRTSKAHTIPYDWEDEGVYVDDEYNWVAPVFKNTGLINNMGVYWNPLNIYGEPKIYFNTASNEITEDTNIVICWYEAIISKDSKGRKFVVGYSFEYVYTCENDTSYLMLKDRSRSNKGYKTASTLTPNEYMCSTDYTETQVAGILDKLENTDGGYIVPCVKTTKNEDISYE